MSSDNRRDQLIDIIRREFIGPDPIDSPGFSQENGEEILTSDPPRVRYAAGILFPQTAPVEQELAEDDEEQPCPDDDTAPEDNISDNRENTGGNFELSLTTCTLFGREMDELRVNLFDNCSW